MDEYNLLHVLRISRWGCPHRQIKNLGITTNTHPLTRNNRVVFLLLTCICLGPVQTAVSLQCIVSKCALHWTECQVPGANLCRVNLCSSLLLHLGSWWDPTHNLHIPPPADFNQKHKNSAETCKLGCNVQLHVGACATSTSPHPPQLTIPLQRTALAH